MRPASPPAPSKRKLAILVPVRAFVGLVILVAGLGLMQVLVATREEPARVDAPEQAIAVETIQVEGVRVPRVSTGFGTARAKHSADVSAEISGQVEHRPDNVDPGEWVERGDLLIQIDAREYEDLLAVAMQAVEAIQAQLRALAVEEESIKESLALAEEAVRLTRNELDRRREAVEAGSVNPFELEVVQRDLTRVQREAETLRQQSELIPVRREQLRAELESQRANVRLAELNVERCTILAPQTGVLQEVFIEEGERIAPGAGVARIVDLRLIEVPIAAPVSAVAYISVGDPVDLRPSGAGDAIWSGQVSRLAPEADPTTRTISVFIEVDQEHDRERGNRSGLLLPGQFVFAKVLSPIDHERVIVPRSAVVRDRVRVVGSDGRLQTRPVEVGYAIDREFPALHPFLREWLVLEGGLSEGDRVVVTGADDLPDGALVEAIDAQVVRAEDADGGSG